MNFYLTNVGKEHMAKVNAGELQLHFSKAVTGSGTSSSLELLTNVVEEQQQIQLDEVYAEGEYTFITCVLSNLESTKEYVLRQIGLFAFDEAGKEQLIIIGQNTYGDRIPLLAEKEVEYLYNIGMKVSNTSEVIFDFSVNDFVRKKLFYEHLEEFEEYQKKIQDQFEALPRVKVGPEDELDRKDTILFETLPGTNKVTRIMERDSKDRELDYDLAAVFNTAKVREEIQSEETLSVLFGKIKKYLNDLKPNVFKEADNPLVLMTEAQYKSPALRTEGSLYGLITRTRGLIILFFDRYMTGTEAPTVEQTIYGIETEERTDAERDDSPYKGIFSNIVYLKDGDTTTERQEGILYAIEKSTK